MEIVVSLIAVVIIIGIPTWLIVRIYKKADENTIVYPPDEVTRRLRKGFFISNWGIEFVFGAIPAFALIFCDVNIVFQFAAPTGSAIIGFILLFVGRIQVGLMTRYINFCNRDRTALEEWVLNAMQGIEDSAMNRTWINSMTRLTPGVTDDMLATINSKGVISGFMSVSSVYTGKNVFKNHWPIICIAMMILVAVLKTVVA